MRLQLFVVSSCVLLAACAKSTATHEALPPETVLAKAAKATQTLESAQYVLTSTIDANAAPLWNAQAEVRMDGILRDAGKQMRFQMDTDATVKNAGQNYTVDATLEVVVASQQEVYMNLHSLTVQPQSTILRSDLVGKLASKWWLLPQGDQLPAAEVTPDPRLLHAQSEVVRIVKDHGMTKVDGNDVYFYDVELDEQKLLTYMRSLDTADTPLDLEKLQKRLGDVTAKGQLWIDAETYYVHKIMWNIDSYPLESAGTVDIDFTVTFSSHNDAPEIIPPTDAKMFSPYELLSPPSSDAFDSGQFVPGDDEMMNTLIRTMNPQ